MNTSTTTDVGLSMIDLDTIARAPLRDFPYPHIVVSDFIRHEWKRKLLAVFPHIDAPGSFPLSSVLLSHEFMRLIDELNGESFRYALEDKFSLNLERKPVHFSLRGKSRSKDGKVQIGSQRRKLMAMLFMNPGWDYQTGRLRILKSKNIHDVAVEVSPSIGNLVVFEPCEYSFHGYLPYEGDRHLIEMHWMEDPKIMQYEETVHNLQLSLRNYLTLGFDRVFGF